MTIALYMDSVGQAGSMGRSHPAAHPDGHLTGSSYDLQVMDEYPVGSGPGASEPSILTR
jgi:hypothetical protein